MEASASRPLLSPFAATSLVVASMIGVGVFTSLGFQVAELPSATPVLMLWLVGGIASLCGALCYAELVTMMPRSGGEYHLLRESYHPLLGFLAGWVSLTAGFAAPIALAASAFARYANALGWLAEPHLIGSALILLMAAVNLRADAWLGRFLSGFTVMKVMLIVLFIVGAIFLPSSAVSTRSLAPQSGDLALCFSPAFAMSLFYVMYAFEGWNGAVYVAGEVRDPERQMPRALIIGTLIVLILYLLLNAVCLWRVPWELLRGKEEAALIAAQHIFGQRGGSFMGALIAFGLVSTVASMICAGSRVNERLGQDLPFLRVLARRNASGAPWVSVLTVAALAMIMLYKGTFQQVLLYVEALLMMSSCLVVSAVIWLRIRCPDAPRPFRVPGYPITPLIYGGMVIYVLIIMWMKHPTQSAIGVATLAVGALIYGIGSKQRPS